MITVKARFDGHVFIPEQPVNLPVGYILDIPIVPPPDDTVATPPMLELLEMLEQLPANPDWPADGAVQHDHYLTFTERRRLHDPN